MKKEYEIKEKLEELLEQIKLKTKNCGDKTKEDRARKGVYVDCITMIRETANSGYPLLADVRADIQELLKSIKNIKEANLWFKYDGWEKDDAEKIIKLEYLVEKLSEHFS